MGTGDLSELAMGWCTYNGDHMSMYGVNASVPKTLVRHLCAYVAASSEERIRAVLLDILDTPVSPELLPPDENGKIAQKTEDNIGPYELHDFFLYYFVRFGFLKEKISLFGKKSLRRPVFGRRNSKMAVGIFKALFYEPVLSAHAFPTGRRWGRCLCPRGEISVCPPTPTEAYGSCKEGVLS